jgi:hypothetical protein
MEIEAFQDTPRDLTDNARIIHDQTRFHFGLRLFQPS